MHKTSGFSLIELMFSLSLLAVISAGVIRTANGALIQNKSFHVETVMHELALDKLEQVAGRFPDVDELAFEETDLQVPEFSANVSFNRNTEINHTTNKVTVTVSTKTDYFIDHTVVLEKRLLAW